MANCPPVRSPNSSSGCSSTLPGSHRLAHCRRRGWPTELPRLAAGHRSSRQKLRQLATARAHLSDRTQHGGHRLPVILRWSPEKVARLHPSAGHPTKNPATQKRRHVEFAAASRCRCASSTTSARTLSPGCPQPSWAMCVGAHATRRQFNERLLRGEAM